MNRVIARRWGDNDHYLGPFTFAIGETYKPLAVALSSTDDEDRGCSLRVSAFGVTVIAALPCWVLPPERVKVFPVSWDEDTVRRLGRNWYWDITRREFGVSLHDGHLSVQYGRQTHDSRTHQSWGCFLPWTQWRHVRHSLYGLDGALFSHLPANWRFGTPEYAERERLESACPTATFAFQDFDGEALTVTTKIEEHAWKFGKGWFKWLSLFRAQKVRRTLDLHFSGETGNRKGSWKGGTIGHAIEMLPGELHEAAFRRYCAEHEMTFVGAA